MEATAETLTDTPRNAVLWWLEGRAHAPHPDGDGIRGELTALTGPWEAPRHEEAARLGAALPGAYYDFFGPGTEAVTSTRWMSGGPHGPEILGGEEDLVAEITDDTRGSGQFPPRTPYPGAASTYEQTSQPGGPEEHR